MADKKDRFVEAVAKLIELTQDGTIEWESAELHREDIKVESVFTAIYKDKLLRICKYRYKPKTPDPRFTISGSTTTMFYGREETPSWETSITLEFIDGYGLRLWKFPYTNALYDLLSAIQYSVAGVDEFLDELINDE